MTAQSKETTQQNSIGKALVRIFAVALMVLVASYPMVTEATSDQVRRPLDLPSGGGRDKDEDEQPLPDLIQFFGHDFEGDAFVWVLDVSASMSNGGRIDKMRTEFIEAITSLSSQTDFGAVAFSSNMLPFDLNCFSADNSRKAAVSGWISSINPQGVTCMATAVIQGLELVRKSSHSNRRLILVGDGQPYCGGIADPVQDLEDILEANWDRIPIDAIFIGGVEDGLNFFQSLANANDGRLVISQ